MEPKRIKLTPEAGPMIVALAGKHGMNPTAAIRELAANSLDAKSRWIRFVLDRRRRVLEIIDGGVGTNRTEDIITPFKRRDHASTGIGQYGIGGTTAQIWLTEGTGKSTVVSVTRQFVNSVVGDFGAMIRNGELEALQSSVPNEGQPTGTRIVLTGIRELNKNHLGSIRRELKFTFAPALRRGVEIGFEVDGKYEPWEPYEAPPHEDKVSIDVTVDGYRWRGFCAFVKHGEKNFVRGWAFGKGDQFIKVYTDPAGSEPLDFGRIYGELMAPRDYPGFNDLKDDFIEYPTELMRIVGEQSARIVARARQEGQAFEIMEATRIAQERLDSATGFSSQGIKGKRGKGRKKGASEPTGEGSPHANFSKSQPGLKGSQLPRRIMLNWSSGMELPFEISRSPAVVNFLLSLDHPSMAIYRKADAGEFLFQFVAASVGSDAILRGAMYEHFFPDMAAQSLPEAFDYILARLKRPDRAA